MKPVAMIFDRALLARRRARSAPDWSRYDFLHRQAAARLGERLRLVKRPFRRALDLGCRGGEMTAHLLEMPGIEHVVMSDLTPAFARMAATAIAPQHKDTRTLALAADEEALPFGAGVFDLIVSCLGLHTVNDLPGTLAQLRPMISPGGLLLVNLFGGGTLGALRTALIEAESATYGGAGARIAPFVDIRDAGHLAQRAGFIETVVDHEPITVTYDSLRALTGDLRGMGETNILLSRRRTFERRRLFSRAESFYPERDPENRLIATFHILTLTAWAPGTRSSKGAQ